MVYDFVLYTRHCRHTNRDRDPDSACLCRPGLEDIHCLWCIRDGNLVALPDTGADMSTRPGH